LEGAVSSEHIVNRRENYERMMKESNIINNHRFLLFQGSMKQTHGIVFKFSQHELIKRGKAKIEAKFGAVNIEIGYSMLDTIAKCLRPYRSQYCFRDLFSTPRIMSKCKRGIVIDNGAKNECLSTRQRKEIIELITICPLMDTVDNFIFNKDLSLDFSCNDVGILLTEEQATECFTNIKIGPKKLQIEKVNERCAITTSGLTIETNKPFSFTSYFIRVYFVFNFK
jgi:hypothetical protein